MTKIIFMGTPDFSATVLKGLLKSNQYDILAVVTQPDRAVGRKKEIRMTPVKQVALEYDLVAKVSWRSTYSLCHHQWR